MKAGLQPFNDPAALRYAGVISATSKPHSTLLQREEAEQTAPPAKQDGHDQHDHGAVPHSAASATAIKRVSPDTIIFWLVVFTSTVQLYRFGLGFVKLLVDGLPSIRVASADDPDAFINVLGYVSYHVSQPQFKPALVHHTCALLWTGGILAHRVWNKSWSRRTHKAVGILLSANGTVSCLVGLYKAASTQKNASVRLYFYIVGGQFIFGQLAGWYALYIRDTKRHLLWMRFCLELPIVLSLFVEWLVMLLQHFLPYQQGEAIGLYTGQVLGISLSILYTFLYANGNMWFVHRQTKKQA